MYTQGRRNHMCAQLSTHRSLKRFVLIYVSFVEAYEVCDSLEMKIIYAMYIMIS